MSNIRDSADDSFTEKEGEYSGDKFTYTFTPHPSLSLIYFIIVQVMQLTRTITSNSLAVGNHT